MTTEEWLSKIATDDDLAMLFADAIAGIHTEAEMNEDAEEPWFDIIRRSIAYMVEANQK